MIIPWTCVSCWKRPPGLRFCVDPRLEVAQRAVPGCDDADYESLNGDDDADMIMIVMIPGSLVGDDDAVADDSDDP